MAKPQIDYKFDRSNEGFVNPYNFVGVDLSCRSRTDIDSLGDTFTGWLEYTILAKTPIAMPDSQSVKVKTLKKGDSHKKYRFMRNPEGTMMIPGSSIRGVIRNVFETATDSCFSTTKDRDYITARQTNAGKAGILKVIKDDENNPILELYSADYYMLKTKDNLKHGERNKEVWNSGICPIYSVARDGKEKYIRFNGAKIYSGETVHFKALKDKNNNYVQYMTRNRGKEVPCGRVVKELTASGASEGILVLGEDIYNKHHERIFVERKRIFENEQQKVTAAYKGMLKTLSIYRNKGVNKNLKTNHTGYAGFERMKKNGLIPVYYKQFGNILYLQFAAVGRVAFNNDMVALSREKKPCKQRNDLCKACALFGMIGEKSLGSRVRFEDAICKADKKIKTREVILAELGAPRPAYMPFYSTMREDDDATSIGYDDINVDIRGRKYYWHHKPCDDDLNARETNRNATVEVVETGTRFCGKIYFDSITSEELSELVWAINFWENCEDGNYCHKIGRGKPLGLGSCKLTVDSISIRVLEGENYSIVPGTFNENAVFDAKENPFAEYDKTIHDLLIISDFHALDGMTVCYPDVIHLDDKSEYNNENDYARHHWFTKNKLKRYGRVQLLPEIESDSVLYPLTAEVNKDTYKSRSYNKKRRY